MEAFPGREPNDLVLWVESHRAVVAGDTLIDRGQGLELPVDWLPEGVPPEQVVAALRPLLELPVELVLATHGGHTDRAATRARALLTPEAGSMVPEARLEKTEHGVAPTGDGWYVLNLRDAEWRHARGRGAVCVVADDFEGWRREADQLGVNPFVLGPGEAMAMYHWEADQEDFLVVSGEAVLIVDGEERYLRAWDFVHCPPGTKHVLVGAGSGPCLVIAVGARAHEGQPGSLGFTADEVAKRHGASVEEDTTDGDVAYAHVPRREPTAYRDGWLPA